MKKFLKRLDGTDWARIVLIVIWVSFFGPLLYTWSASSRDIVGGYFSEVKFSNEYLVVENVLYKGNKYCDVWIDISKNDVLSFMVNSAV